MTVSSSTDRATFPGNGVAVAFSLPFRFFTNSDVVAQAIVDSTGVATPLTLGVDYTLTGAGQPEEAGAATGVLTTTAPVPVGVTLFVQRIIPATQPTDIVNQGRFFPEVHETVFDRLTMLVQQNQGSLSRTLRVQDYDPVPDKLPSATQRALKIMSFDADGNPVAIDAAADSALSLRQDLLAPTGAGIVGFDASETYPAGTVGEALQTVGNTTIDSVFAIATAAQSLTSNVNLASYHTGWAALATPPKGGGVLRWAPNVPKASHNGGTIFSPTVPWDGTQANLAAYLAGTGETTPAGNGCFVRINPRKSVLEFGARADNTTNDRASFQKAGDAVKTVLVPDGTYALTGTLLFNSDGVSWNGESMSGTVLNFSGAGTAFRNPVSNATTRLFCGLSNLRINALAAGANPIVDWKSIQFGFVRKVWILGQSVGGCVCLNMAAVWTTTECTYNVVEDCYMGLFAQGISISDGANNNNILRNRFQPSLASGIGIFLSATAPGRVSVINIHGNGFEYPGAISTGINVFQNCDGVFMSGNRFEQLLNGIVVGAVGNKHVSGTSRGENYFESCTNPINLSTGATSARPGLIAGGAWASGVLLGNSFGLGAISSPSTGVYTFTYLDTTYPNSAQVVQVTASTPIAAVTQTATGFTVTCQNSSGVATAAALLAVSVSYNQ